MPSEIKSGLIKRTVKNYDCENNEIAKHCWEEDHNIDQKRVVGRNSRLISRKIKGTMHYLNNSNQFRKVSYMLPEI